MGCAPPIGGAPMMFGQGMPMMVAPQMMPQPMRQPMQMPAQPMRQPIQMPAQPMSQPVPPPAQPMQAVTPPVASPAVAAVPRPVVRAQAADETPPARPAPLSMPSPEQLGIAPAAAPAPVEQPGPPVDWNAARQRLERVGAVAFRCDPMPGGVRVTILVPNSQGARHIEAEAATEAVALACALERAEAGCR